MVCCLLCPDTPPEKVSAKGARGGGYQMYLDKQNNPETFATPLAKACCAEPGCCCIATLGTPLGCTACYSRKSVLDTYYNGIQDFVCLQGYLDCCCCKVSSCCPGSMIGLCCEGFWCNVLAISIARLHLMEKKRIRPDPMDYQIIACANCLQLLACLFDILAIFISELREAACIIDIVADLVMCSVGGCMGTQVYHEIKEDKKKGIANPELMRRAPAPQQMARP